MITAIVICVITCVSMITLILVKPSIKIGKITIDTYWIAALVGAVVLLLSFQFDIKAIGQELIADSAINPLKILVLFISMTVLSIFLDELGFFSYLASITLKRAKTSQFRLFLYLYLIVSVLTVFTSNDVIILSFTPFICYFAKNAKIDPMPYLAAEFVAANTWSMALVIGNPTNIYLATASDISFLAYVKVMALPTVVAGVVSFGMLFLVFRKKLTGKIEGQAEDVTVKDKVNLVIGIIHLGACTILLAISSYIGIEMWIVSLIAVISLFVSASIASIVRKQKPKELISCIKRAPWQMIPFVLSMFVLILGLTQKGVTEKLASLLPTGNLTVFTYGLTSFLTANIINNIPMSVLFASITQSLPVQSVSPTVYSSIVGSNIGAIFTPIGALAGIMWSSLLNVHGYKFSYKNFLFMGITIGIPTLLATLGMLFLMIGI